MGESPGSIQVLHVDDDPGSRDVVSTVLAEEPLSVTTVGSARDGLALLDASAVECIVSEYRLPGMDGLAFLEAVRERDQRIPFILFTETASGDIALDALDAGVTDHLQKAGGTAQYRLLRNRIEHAVERYRLEQETATLNRGETLFDHLPDFAVVTDADCRITDVNRRLAAESDSTDLIGLPLWELASPPEQEAVRTACAELDAGERDMFDGRIDQSDGTVRTIAFHVTRVHDDGDPRFLAVGRPISPQTDEHRQLDRLLEFSENALRATDSLIWGINLETGEVTTLYGSIASLFRDEPSECEDVTSFFARRVHPDDVSRVEHTYEAIRRGERIHFNVEFRTHPDRGEVRWIESTGKRQVVGDTRHLVGLSTDVTAQKRREETLVRKNERLDDFASVISHDLRNPLNVAQGQLALHNESCEGGEELDAIGSALERMEVLIDDLLSLARGGETVEDLGTVDLESVVRSAWQTVATPDATLDVTGSQSMLADRSRLQQLLENLFGNAVDHAGPAVTVTVGPLEDANGFYVADDGPGIPAAERDQVFESGYSTSPEGTGFGLPIVSEIAEAHGWDVAIVESSAGGARFEISAVEPE